MFQGRTWPRLAVVGAGAVGGYFGGLLAHAGAPVTMIGRKPFVEAVKKNGLLLDTLTFRKSVSVEVSTDMSAVRGADLVLFCVKTTDNAATARELASFLDPSATVISLQNGVDNVQQIKAAANIEALPAAVYIAASVPEPGHIKHVARGDLVVGPKCEQAKKVADIFVNTSIPCRVSDNIEGELWSKLVWNCALNAVSALGQARYGRIAESFDARKLVEAIVDEVFRVAHAAHVVFPGIEDSKAANGWLDEDCYANGRGIVFHRSRYNARQTHGDRFTKRIHRTTRGRAGRTNTSQSHAVRSCEASGGSVRFIDLDGRSV